MSNPETGTPADATQQTGSPEQTTPPVADSIEKQLELAEQRRKETQAAYTRGQQALKAKEAELEALKQQLSSAVSVTLTPEQKQELDDLKYEDPDAWREKLNSFETKAKQEANAKFAELTGEAGKAAGVQFELERRQQVLEEFNASASIAITDEIISNEVPPRITNKLARNEISFEEFLTEVSSYLNKGKTVANPETLGQPNMGKIGGSVSPKDFKPEKTLSDGYSKLIL
jgi:hypothetical protein